MVFAKSRWRHRSNISRQMELCVDVVARSRDDPGSSLEECHEIILDCTMVIRRDKISKIGGWIFVNTLEMPWFGLTLVLNETWRTLYQVLVTMGSMRDEIRQSGRCLAWVMGRSDPYVVNIQRWRNLWLLWYLLSHDEGTVWICHDKWICVWM